MEFLCLCKCGKCFAVWLICKVNSWDSRDSISRILQLHMSTNKSTGWQALRTRARDGNLSMLSKRAADSLRHRKHAPARLPIITHLAFYCLSILLLSHLPQTLFQKLPQKHKGKFQKFNLPVWLRHFSGFRLNTSDTDPTYWKGISNPRRLMYAKCQLRANVKTISLLLRVSLCFNAFSISAMTFSWHFI